MNIETREVVAKVRQAKTNIVGAAYKISVAEIHGTITDAERAALAGRHTWENHREEILDLLEAIRPSATALAA